MNEQAPRRPLPTPAPESQPFWDAARQHRLSLQRCRDCGGAWFPPARSCTHCLSTNAEWVDAKGTGTIFSVVVVHRVYHPWFADKVPYAVAVVEFDEGPRILTNIVTDDPSSLRCGMRVEVVFDDASENITLPKFVVSGAA